MVFIAGIAERITCHRFKRTAVDVPGLAAEQEGIGLGHRLKEVHANVIVPIRLRPAAMRKAACGVFLRAPWRLDHAVQRDEFSDNKFSHVAPLMLGLSIVAAQR